MRTNFNSRLHFKEIAVGTTLPMFKEIPVPLNEIHWSRSLKNPLMTDWVLSKELAAECSNYFIRKWKRKWAMSVLRHAATFGNGCIFHGEISYRVVFANCEINIGFFHCREDVTEIKFSFRSHPKGNFVIVQYCRPEKEF